MKRSLHARLGIPLTIVLSAVMGLQWLLVSLALDALVEEYVAGRLEHDASNLLASLKRNPDGFELPPGSVDPIYRQPRSGHYFQILTREGIIRSRSLWDQAMESTTLEKGQRRLSRQPGPDHTPLMVLARGFQIRDHPVTIVVAEDFKAATRILHNLRWFYGGISLGALLVLLALIRFTLRRGLAPMSEAALQLAALERGDREKLDPGPVPLEVRPFMDEINRLLTVLLKRLERSRESAGNLGHAIKTPLTLLSRLVSHPKLVDAPDIREQLHTQIEAIRQLSERELGLARLSGGRGSRVWVSLHPEVTALIEVMKQVHRERRLIFDIHVHTDLQVGLDREDFLTLLGNLLDNASRHASRHIGVTATLEVSQLVLSVEDDGPGIPDEQRNRLLERGVHGNGHVHGHGLGFSICLRIVEDYQGQFLLRQSNSHGGLSVVILLPASYGRYH